MEKLLTPRQVCEALQISAATFWRMVKRGTLPVVRVGGQVRVRESRLDAWILAHEAA